jgi:hypothetical protein
MISINSTLPRCFGPTSLRQPLEQRLRPDRVTDLFRLPTEIFGCLVETKLQASSLRQIICNIIASRQSFELSVFFTMEICPFKSLTISLCGFRTRVQNVVSLLNDLHKFSPSSLRWTKISTPDSLYPRQLCGFTSDGKNLYISSGYGGLNAEGAIKHAKHNCRNYARRSSQASYPSFARSEECRVVRAPRRHHHPLSLPCPLRCWPAWRHRRQL